MDAGGVSGCGDGLGDVAAVVAAALRHGRHEADLSQRELAAAAGVSSSMVGRAEVGDPTMPLRVIARLFTHLGLRMAVVDSNGVFLDVIVGADVTDRAGRRYPAHLDVRPVTRELGSWWGDLRWGYVPSRNPLRPQFTFDRRYGRDERRSTAAQRALRQSRAAVHSDESSGH